MQWKSQKRPKPSTANPKQVDHDIMLPKIRSIDFTIGDYVESFKNYGKAVELCSDDDLNWSIWNEAYWGAMERCGREI